MLCFHFAFVLVVNHIVFGSAANYEPCVGSMKGIYFQIHKAGSNIFFWIFGFPRFSSFLRKSSTTAAMPRDASESEEHEEKEDFLCEAFVSTRISSLHPLHKPKSAVGT